MSTQTLTVTRTRQPRTLAGILLRLEGFALFGAALVIYFTQGYGWLTLILLLLVPDLAALGYLVSARVGNRCYNLAHTLVVPLVLAVLAGLTGQMLGLQLALIWLAHIGMDRTVGYGFKEGELPMPAHHTNR
jgi:hypothetical protein